MPGFWTGKKVFLTGHTGFKGSWLSLWLQKLGADVTGYSLPPPTKPNLFELARVKDGMRSIEGDIRDLAKLTEAMRVCTPQIVFHLAAQPLVRESYRTPVETYSTNVMGSVHVLEAVRGIPQTKAVVMVTTDKCYENREWVWSYRENEPMGGHDPYSNSKGCAELVVSAYRKSFFTGSESAKIASARAGNVIGGGDFAEDRLVPDIVRAIQTGKQLEIRSPNATRPWQHVLEPLSGYLQLAERLFANDGAQYAEAWNFGPRETDAWPVQRVVEEFQRIKSKVKVVYPPQASGGLHEAGMLKLDISKAKHQLGWEPRLPLSKGLEWTSEWYQAYLNSEDVRSLTLRQIEAFGKENLSK